MEASREAAPAVVPGASQAAALVEVPEGSADDEESDSSVGSWLREMVVAAVKRQDAADDSANERPDGIRRSLNFVEARCLLFLHFAKTFA